MRRNRMFRIFDFICSPLPCFATNRALRSILYCIQNATQYRRNEYRFRIRIVEIYSYNSVHTKRSDVRKVPLKKQNVVNMLNLISIWKLFLANLMTQFVQ